MWTGFPIQCTVYTHLQYTYHEEGMYQRPHVYPLPSLISLPPSFWYWMPSCSPLVSPSSAIPREGACVGVTMWTLPPSCHGGKDWHDSSQSNVSGLYSLGTCREITVWNQPGVPGLGPIGTSLFSVCDGKKRYVLLWCALMKTSLLY